MKRGRIPRKLKKKWKYEYNSNLVKLTCRLQKSWYPFYRYKLINNALEVTNQKEDFTSIVLFDTIYDLLIVKPMNDVEIIVMLSVAEIEKNHGLKLNFMNLIGNFI